MDKISAVDFLSVERGDSLYLYLGSKYMGMRQLPSPGGCVTDYRKWLGRTRLKSYHQECQILQFYMILFY